MLLDEEDKLELAARLKKQMSDEKINKKGSRDSEENMLQARLSNVDLSIDTSNSTLEESKDSAGPQKQKQRELDNQLDACLDMMTNQGPVDYRAKINLHLQMEKLKMIAQASTEGITEEQIEQLLQEENLPDFNLDHLKQRLNLDEFSP